MGNLKTNTDNNNLNHREGGNPFFYNCKKCLN